MERSEHEKLSTFFLSIITVIVVLSVIKALQNIFLPLMIAFFIVLLFQPVNRFLVKNKIPKSVTIFFDLIILIILFAGIINLLFASFTEFAERLPEYKIKLDKILQIYAGHLGIKNFTLTKFLEENINFSGLFRGIFSSTVSMLSTTILVLFFFIFLSSGIEKFTETIIKYFSKKGDDRLQNRIKNIPQQIQKYIVTKTFISLLTAILVGIILFLFEVDFWLIWVTLTFLLNFIPNFGSIIATILPTAMVLVQFDSAGKALLFLVISSVVQNVVGNFLEPKILGEKLGLNPIVILLSLLIWGYVWGIAGMFLAVPFTAVIKILISGTESKQLNFLSELIS